MFSAASTRRPRSCSGAKILASTSLSRVKCRTSSLGRAVITSVKWVIAGKISIGWSGLEAPSRPASDPRAPKGLEAPIEDRGGFVRVWRKGCARRLDAKSGGCGLLVFMVCAKRGEEMGILSVSGEVEESCARRARGGLERENEDTTLESTAGFHCLYCLWVWGIRRVRSCSWDEVVLSWVRRSSSSSWVELISL